jgi:hypothetical protein
MVECPECGAGADLTKDGLWAHCASCKCRSGRTASACTSAADFRIGNTVFEPGKEGSHYKGSGSGSGDKEEGKKTDNKESEKGGEDTK